MRQIWALLRPVGHWALPVQRQRPLMPAPPPQGMALKGSQAPLPQRMPQPPQWLGLVEMSTAAPPQQRIAVVPPALVPSPRTV